MSPENFKKLKTEVKKILQEINLIDKVWALGGAVALVEELRHRPCKEFKIYLKTQGMLNSILKLVENKNFYQTNCKDKKNATIEVLEMGEINVIEFLVVEDLREDSFSLKNQFNILAVPEIVTDLICGQEGNFTEGKFTGEKIFDLAVAFQTEHREKIIHELKKFPEIVEQFHRKIQDKEKFLLKKIEKLEPNPEFEKLRSTAFQEVLNGLSEVLSVC